MNLFTWIFFIKSFYNTDRMLLYDLFQNELIYMVFGHKLTS